MERGICAKRGTVNQVTVEYYQITIAKNLPRLMSAPLPAVHGQRVEQMNWGYDGSASFKDRHELHASAAPREPVEVKC